MSEGFSAPFIRHPVATILLMVAILFVGIVSYPMLPVASLPQIDFPTIQVSANLPGADAETMAASVAQPLETQFAQISGVTEMTSSSSLGNAQVTIQFSLDRDIDAAAGDVERAINAAGGNLPKNLPSPPTLRKVNPADAPVMQLSAKSDTLSLTQLDELIETRIVKRMTQVAGVAQVNIGGQQKPAVRIEVDPAKLAATDLTLEDVRSAIGVLSLNAPKGNLDAGSRTFPIYSNDQITDAETWNNSVIAFRNGAPIFVRDIGKAVHGPEDSQRGHWTNGEKGIALDVFRQPGANVIGVVNKIKEILPSLQASLPSTVQLALVTDRTTTIRASVSDVQVTLFISIALVVLVIFLFLRSVRATIIPSIAVPLALVGTLALMWVAGFSINNLSLMALVVAVGFVVDDAIVMLENIQRHIEDGMAPLDAALKGSKEIGFTIVSISVSLVAVLIPIMLMGGVVGALFREFAFTLAIAIAISAVVSLTLTPMTAAKLLRPENETQHGKFYAWTENLFNRTQEAYGRALDVVLRYRMTTLAVFFATIAATAYLFVVIDKGFFPEQDTGFVPGLSQAAPDVSFTEMSRLHEALSAELMKDPAVYSVFMDIGGGNGGNAFNTGHVNITLKPRSERDVSARQFIERVKPKLAQIPGVQLFLQPAQDINIGGRPAKTLYQYTLQDADIAELGMWSDKILEALKKVPGLTGVASDQQQQAPTLALQIDRAAAGAYNVLPQTIDDTIYDAFGQRQVTQYTTQVNTYHVVLEVANQAKNDIETLDRLNVRSTTGALVPLSSVAHWTTTSTAPVSVSHQGQIPSVTISFNLKDGTSIGEATAAITKTVTALKPPATLQTGFAGSAKAFQDSLSSVPLLIAASLFVVYLILGILYESFIHPITILSTLAPAGLGALVALMLAGFDFGLVAMIGVILLIGIVKKNGIMLVDFAVEAERKDGLSSTEAIRKAALLRFRPILMTTMAAILGGIPLMLGHGAGAELRQPLGYAIVGGLVVSQLLTLFTTPVIYILLDRLSRSAKRQPATQLQAAE